MELEKGFSRQREQHVQTCRDRESGLFGEVNTGACGWDSVRRERGVG